MAEAENSLFAIDVDTDDYADAAAEDTPAVDRTFQSEADFAAVKASYTARQDGGDFYSELVQSLPCLAENGEGKGVKLNKPQQLLFGYAVGELYYDGEYGRIVDVCDRALERCELDSRLKPSVERWREKAMGKTEKAKQGE